MHPTLFTSAGALERKVEELQQQLRVAQVGLSLLALLED
jgi:hypothetical protein